MKYKIFLLIALLISLPTFISCSNEENPATPLKGSLFVESSPSGAEIWINGDNTRLVTPNTVKDLTPGNYIVTLKLKNYNDTTFAVDVDGGKLTSVSISFQPDFGSIYISSDPSFAEIWLDGVNTSRFTPYSIPDLVPGNYTLTLRLQNYYDTTFVIPVIAGQQTSRNITLVPLINTGSIYITSNPMGAQIWLNGTNTGKVTPDTVKSINAGWYSVTLKLTNYYDSTFSVSVTAGEMSIVGPIVLVSNIHTKLYGPVRIYETAGTTPSQPAGLDLSTGNAWGVSSDSSGVIDIYYYSDATHTIFRIQSADLHPNLIRQTDFFVGSNSNLFDGIDSPLRSAGTWTNNMSDRESNYVFLYDHDGHYSKLKIVNWGGGVPGVPAWVDVQWYYNKTTLDNRFK